ncbi:MAG: hypothetical protein IJ421_02205 [Prevotella sp.]|nr:hypothetical protein [Prevotella sp.]
MKQIRFLLILVVLFPILIGCEKDCKIDKFGKICRCIIFFNETGKDPYRIDVYDFGLISNDYNLNYIQLEEKMSVDSSHLEKELAENEIKELLNPNIRIITRYLEESELSTIKNALRKCRNAKTLFRCKNDYIKYDKVLLEFNGKQHYFIYDDYKDTDIGKLVNELIKLSGDSIEISNLIRN